MKKRLLIPIILTLVILSSILVFAAGSGGGTSPETSALAPECSQDSECSTIICSQPKNSQCFSNPHCSGNKCICVQSCAFQEENRTNKPKEEPKENCEAYSNLSQRIQCRLEKRGLEFNVTEESCRVLANPSNCQSLYNKVAACYDQSGFQKDECFKRIAGFTQAKVSEEAKANNKQALRNYIIFLLYDLQEKVEDSYEDNKINSTTASEVISIIIEVKQAIILNKTKEEIKPMLQQLKIKIQELKI